MKKRLFNRVNREELKKRALEDPRPRTTFSFYVYAHIQDPQVFRDELYLLLNDHEVCGRVYVSYEGVNAQVCVPNEKFDSLESNLRNIDIFANIRLNIAIEEKGFSFYKLAVKVRKKIVADGIEDASFDVTKRGIHIDAKTFNELAREPNSVIVDMRNHYESEVGHFESALCPDVETFQESLPLVDQMLKHHADKHIIMYCTGGIRCEKASAYLKHKGYKNVYQLEGGIIEYTRQVKELGLENKFKGKNFVFDERMGERISDEIIAHCHQCGIECDDHVNCANDACHILFIQCPSCAKKYAHTCSIKCQEFIKLPPDIQKVQRKATEFNGTKFGKGRYKALHQQDLLNLD